MNSLDNNKVAQISTPFQLEERRRKVAGMLARSMTEEEIGKELGVDQSTISRDIKALKEDSQQFVFDLAKSDLAYYYKNKLESLEEVKRKAWQLYNSTNEDSSDVDKVRLLALKLVIQADEAGIKLLDSGPTLLTIKSLNDRVLSVINGNNEQTNQ